LYPLGAVIQPSRIKGVFRHHSVATAEANLHMTACILPSKMYKIYSESKAVHMNAMKEWFHLFLTSALDGVSVQLHAAGEGHPVPIE